MATKDKHVAQNLLRICFCGTDTDTDVAPGRWHYVCCIGAFRVVSALALLGENTNADLLAINFSLRRH